MTRSAARTVPAGARAAASWLPLVVLLFAGSGCAALIYQIVWLQLLQLVVGSTAVSLGVLLGTFMGGMCLGSALLPRVVRDTHHPLNIYAALELAIGAAAIIILHAMPLVNSLYTTTGGGTAWRAAVAVICLLPPTAMMGATLPAIARWVETTPAGISWLGFFYAGNLAGAVLGTGLAGFYLLRVYDMAVTTYVAAGINLLVGLAAIGLAASVPRSSPPRAAAAPPQSADDRVVCVVIALSGLTALAAEIVWTRLLSLTVGATVYAFSLILAAFLVGLGAGSGAGSALARRTVRPRAALAGCQFLLCGAIGWAAYMLAQSLPYAPPVASGDAWASIRHDLWRCLSVVLPASVLWGASFPLALASAATPGQDGGRLAGRIYAWNTAGAIAGSVAGVLLGAYAGSQNTQRVLILCAAASGLAAWLTDRSPQRRTRPARSRLVTAGVALTTVVAGVVAWRVAPIPAALVAYGRHAASWMDVTRVEYTGEGMNAFVAVTRTASGAPIYHAAGKVQASSEGEDMRLQRMLAHFSHLIPDRPRRVLVIGLGAGITAGAISIGPGVERMTIVEIERLVPSIASTYFSDYNYAVVGNPKVSIRIDDARHYLMTSGEQFDVITSDLVDPWVKGTAALFTREFFESVKQHLAPGGVVTMFVQLYLSNMESVKSEIGTFVDVFPNTLVWGNTVEGQGYDLVLTGQVEPIVIDVDRLQAALDSRPYAQVAESLREIGFGSAVELLSTFATTGRDLRPWLQDAPLNTDRNLRLQYLAGLGLDLQQSAPIYTEIVRHAPFPSDVFRGSPPTIEALKASIARTSQRATTVQASNR
jgi:spermidine synthase